MLAVQDRVDVGGVILVDSEDRVRVHLVPRRLDAELLEEDFLDRGDSLAIPAVLAVDADTVGATDERNTVSNPETRERNWRNSTCSHLGYE